MVKEKKTKKNKEYKIDIKYIEKEAKKYYYDSPISQRKYIQKYEFLMSLQKFNDD